jgi:hypothetical protein
MRTLKDRIVDLVLIVLFAGLIGGSAYFIYKVMITWRGKGLG